MREEIKQFEAAIKEWERQIESGEWTLYDPNRNLLPLTNQPPQKEDK